MSSRRPITPGATPTPGPAGVPPLEPQVRTVLVVDVGGTNVKLRASDWPETVRIPSGHAMGPQAMVAAVKDVVGNRRYDAVALGYPGPVRDGRILQEPVNLNTGWVDFDFEAALAAPVRMLNDAAMQALGNYTGGRMLFLGFGTGMGSAMVADGVVMPLELAHLPYRKDRTYEEYVGADGRKRLGDSRWRHHCRAVALLLREAMQVTDVVLGGGNAKRLHKLPEGMRLGRTDAAFAGGLQMWSVAAPPEAVP
jgi:hypothetical protein